MGASGKLTELITDDTSVRMIIHSKPLALAVDEVENSCVEC